MPNSWSATVQLHGPLGVADAAPENDHDKRRVSRWVGRQTEIILDQIEELQQLKSKLRLGELLLHHLGNRAF
jgi:hypothetical protein